MIWKPYKKFWGGLTEKTKKKKRKIFFLINVIVLPLSFYFEIR